LILCSPGLRPWIKGGDIQPKVFGSDHCPVHIDLHDEIVTPDGKVLFLRDMVNPPERQISTAPVYPNDTPRNAPEPPRFATKFLDEFSGKQTSLKSYFGGKAPVRRDSEVTSSPTPTPGLGENPGQDLPEETVKVRTQTPPTPVAPEDLISTPFSLARAAFDSIDTSPLTSQNSQPSSSRRTVSIDLSQVDEEPISLRSTPNTTKRPEVKEKAKGTAKLSASQTKLSSFFAQPPAKAKRKSTTPPATCPQPSPKRPVLPQPFSTRPDIDTTPYIEPTVEEAALIAQAIAEADSARDRKKAEAAPVWSNLFAKKLPPLCTVHHKPCKDFSKLLSPSRSGHKR
jgi:AP endonuclease-2